MIRMTAAQFELFNAKLRSTKTGRRVKRRKEDLPENIVETQIVGFLRARGWIVSRQQSGLFVPTYDLERKTRVRVGEVGMADWRAERPYLSRDLSKSPVFLPPILHWLFYFEVKAPGRLPSNEQLAWLKRRQLTGTPAEWFDCFESSGDCPFLPWYRERFGWL